MLHVREGWLQVVVPVKEAFAADMQRSQITGDRVHSNVLRIVTQYEIQ